jgi:predicted porin
MNKSLIALAIAGAVAVPMAQAQNANVTLYGVADAYLSFAKTAGAPVTGAYNGATYGLTRLESGGVSGSRFGIRGTEAIGGLNANFVLENGFSIDNGTLGQGGALFGRKATVGLSGGFGSIDLGRNYAGAFYNVLANELLGLSNFDPVANLILVPFAGDLLRINNTITYTSPSMGGFTVSSMYGLGEQATATSGANTGSLFQLGFNGNAGPVAMGANYSKRQGGSKNLAAFVGGNFGNFGAQYVYDQNKTFTNVKTTVHVLNGTAGFGAGKALVGFGTTKTDNMKKGSVITAGYEHDLSKRTMVYSYYTKGSRVGLPADGLSYNAAVVTNVVGTHKNESGNPRDLAVGVRHRF